MLLTPAIRPESHVELLMRSFNLYCHAFRRTIVLALLLSGVVFIPRFLGISEAQQIILLLSSDYSFQLLLAGIYLATIWFFGAIYWRVYCVAIQREETYLEDFKAVGKKLLYLIGAGLIIAVIGYAEVWLVYGFHQTLQYFGLLYHKSASSQVFTFVALLLQALFVIYVSTLFIFYFPLIVIENERIILALKQSMQLVWGRVWKTLSFQLIPSLIYLIVIILIKIIFKVNIHIYFFTLSPPPTVLALVLHALLFAAFIPWSVAAMIVQLRDFELREVLTAES